MWIDAGRLKGDNVRFHQSKNHSGSRGQAPSMIVIHYTAGSSLSSAVSTLCSPNSQASAHLVIDRSKHVVQLLDFDQIGWHCGKSYWRGNDQLNPISIGIELVNFGQLEMSGNGQCCTWFKQPVAPDEIFVDGKGRAWHQYSEFQIMTTIAICRALCAEFPIDTIVGHSEIAAGRKVDPGSAFDMDRLRAQVFDTNRRDEDGTGVLPKKLVAVGRLNFRDRPSLSSSQINAVLTSGQKVVVNKQVGEWAQVSVEQTGWVKHQYLKGLE